MNRNAIASSPRGEGAIYVVRRGDTLTKIIQDASQMSLADPAAAIDVAMQDNPQIRHSDRIVVGQTIFVRKDYASAEPLSTELLTDIRAANACFAQLHVEQRFFADTVAPALAAGARGSVGQAVSKLQSGARQSRAMLEGILGHEVPLRERGAISSKTLLRRKQSVDAFVLDELRPARRVLGSNPIEALKFGAAQGRGVRETLQHQVRELGRVANFARYGGVALEFVDFGMTCYSIAGARDRAEKNGLFVEWGVGAATAPTVFAAVLLVTGPVGWGAALAIGAGAGVAAYFAGKGARTIYDTYGRSANIVGLIYVDRICSTDALPFK